MAANAAANLANHARAGNVKWRCASVFALAGVAGAFLGSTLGGMLDRQKLLALFSGRVRPVQAELFEGRPIELDGRRFERHAERNDIPVIADFWAP